MTLITYITHDGDKLTKRLDCDLVEAVDRIAPEAREIHLVANDEMMEKLQRMRLVAEEGEIDSMN